MYGFSFRNGLAVAYIYLISSITCVEQTLAQRSLFSHHMLNYDHAGNPLPVAITKSTEARLEVSIMTELSPGEWHRMRSLGGMLAEDWLIKHGHGHPNTTVKWSNGTFVHPHEVAALMPHVRRWGWGSYLGLAIFEETGAVAVTLASVSVAGVVAGFAAATVLALFGAAAYWLYHGQSSGNTQVHDNNVKLRRRNNLLKNVYYTQTVGNDVMTGHWPSTADMQEAVLDSLQDMADHDYQGACYNLLTFIPQEGKPAIETAQLGFCTWMDGGSCRTPACEAPIGADVWQFGRMGDRQ